MKAVAMLICGKICSGKSTYAKALSQKSGAPVLSADELMLSVLDEQLGSRHEEISRRIREYLFQKGAELLSLGIPVILEWGFWTGESRRAAESFFTGRGFEVQWHYLNISESAQRRNMEKRNLERSPLSYYVDEALFEKCKGLFEPPAAGEVDFWINCG